MEHEYSVGDRVTARSADCGDGEQERVDGRSGEISEIDYRDANLPYLVDFDDFDDFDNDCEVWMSEQYLEPEVAEAWVPKFKEGDLIDYRLSPAWNGSVVTQVGSNTPGFEDTYRVLNPVRGTGTMREEQMVPHALSADDLGTEGGFVLQDGEVIGTYGKVEQSADGLSTTFSIGVVPEVENPAAPTLHDLSNFVDLSDFFSSVTFDVAEPEMVDHPAHYSEGMPEGLEVRDIIKAQGFWKEFCQGNIVKYSLRYQYKNGIEDLRKLRQYTDWLIEELEAEDV